MNCYYHETSEATKYCIHCKKALCDECFHSGYPDYCWSCGLEHDNNLGAAEEDYPYSKWFENSIVLYSLRKLFAALGSCFIFTIFMFIWFGFLGVDEVEAVVMYVGLFTSMIVYTYGIIVSLLIDFAARYIQSLRVWYFNVTMYLVVGLLYPFFADLNVGIHLNIGFDKSTFAIVGGIVSLLFVGLQRSKIKKELIIIGGLISLLPMAIIVLILIDVLITGA
ncbi:B-box zinc finger protein [Cohnella cholangitidis]|uniref:B box-type domain-containing protein n=1 Tax=Cohnella cholangitidis TaxID=2598458 RepID=A0A7G5BSW3_9BACL|nr:hypothetical protein [Cohnella cholangitidis]QMV40047.1 hypothetical protein FPL14_01650 [Cohnella cholangitidis]